MCQVLEATGAASIQEEIQLDGNTVTVRAFKSDGTLHKENSCKVGEEMDNTGPDGRAIKVIRREIMQSQKAVSAYL